MTPVPIAVPKENVSDDAYRFVHCAVEDGAQVEAGDLIASLETSKSIFDIHSPADGYLFLEQRPGDVVKVGSVLGWIAGDRTRPPKPHTSARAEGQDAEERAGPRISIAARALMDKHRLGPGDFSYLRSVTREDVIAHIRRAGSVESPRTDWAVSAAQDPAARAIFIHGGGGHAKMCIDILRAVGGWHIVGILDSQRAPGSTVLGVSVLGVDSDDAFSRMAACGVRFAACGIGLVERHHERHRLHERLKAAGFELPNLVHPHATVEPSAAMGEGNQIMAQAVLGSDARIGNGCIVNAGAIVSHDCRLGDHVHVAPGAILAGGVHVGADTLIGMGATIYLRARIGREVVIANGANVHGDVEDRAIVRA
jgi:sugar O-acyltransferase (sialic acid O-acetyltransferase NeuD family)